MLFFKKAGLFFASFFVFTTSFMVVISPSLSVQRLESCEKSVQSGTGVDGSDCDAGLMCDVTHKVCVYGTESPCKLNGDCMIGRKCYGESGDLLSISGDTVGICKESFSAGADGSPFTIIMCKVIQVMTGPIAKVVVVVVVCWFAIQIGMGKTTVVQFSSLALSVTLYVMAPKISSWMLGGSAACAS